MLESATGIVVPLDGREPSVRAVPIAVRIGGRLELPVRLYSVSDDPGREVWLRDVAARYGSVESVAVSVEQSDDPAAAIARTAGDTELVCMATSASILPHQGRIGSIAEEVVRTVRRPVVLVGPSVLPRTGNSTGRIIAPVDGSEMSETALGYAADLAAAASVPLWVVTVVSRRSEAALAADIGGAATPVVEANYVARLARDLEERAGMVVDFEVLHRDDASEAILEFAGDDGTVVMTTHGRSGLRRIFGGSVATAVVADSPRAVFVWRPDEE
ncbi:MAG: universal stress protein [Acidimicrobiia bacterium]